MSKKTNSSKLIDEDTYKKINELLSTMKPGNEFEMVLYGYEVHLSLEKYIQVLKYLNYISKSKKYEVIHQDMLDVIYRESENTTYRITIDGIDDINRNIEQLHQYKSHTTFNVYLKKILEKASHMSIMKKIKDKENLVDYSDMNLRFRLSEENKVTKEETDKLTNLTYESIPDITFRLKQRISFYIHGTSKSDEFIKIDITTTKMSKYLNNVNNGIPNYELEIELGIDNKSKKSELLDRMLSEATVLLKIVQQSNHIISNSKTAEIISEYCRIGNLDPTKIQYIDARQPISLEVRYLTENLPNRYCVTDKADGDRNFLIIIKNNVYLISTNLNVKDIGIKLPANLSKYNDSILDGEYIFIPSKNRHLFMAFDCLFKGTEDMRKQANLFTRLHAADEIITNCFIFNEQKGFEIKDYEIKIKDNKAQNEFNIENIVKFHNEQLKNYMDTLNKDMEKSKEYPLIRRKYFISVYGAKQWEIFRYSLLLWNKYTTDTTFKCPYILDGMIYQPLEQAYVSNARESKLSDYKWKPPEKNSIDFYIKFYRDRISKKIVTVYDNSNDAYVKNKSYKICHLYVGSHGKFGEEPVLFREDQGGYICHLFLGEGENEVVDIDGNLLSDGTVVEFYYNNDPEQDDKFRWIPIRTRYDKTESVLRYGRRYGNYIDTANGVWRTIINPILVADFEDLAKGNNEKTGNYYYDDKLNKLREKIGHAEIILSAKENVYFQKKTDLAAPMRKFDNIIKSNIIYTYCNPVFNNDKSNSVLDIGCGRGGDIMKFYYVQTAFYVGIDVDRDALTSTIDGAISRYTQLRKTHPGFFKCYFIQADARAHLDYDSQYKVLNGMSKDNTEMLNKFFSQEPSKRTYFDRINCQFALHYFLENDETFKNFKTNIKTYLKPGGYFLATTFDAHHVIEVFKKTQSTKYTEYYTNNKGEKKILFELIKKFKDFKPDEVITTGNALDVFMDWIFNEGDYKTEYLVDRNFIEKEFLQDCDLELVDTGMTYDLFLQQKEFYLDYVKYEENKKTQKSLMDVVTYYNEKDEINKGCYNYTKLFRYYIFRKKDREMKITNKKEQKGGTINFLDEKQYKIPKINDESSFYGSIAHLLKTHKLVPKSLSLKDLFSDFKLDLITDNNLNEDEIRKINKSIIVYHEDGKVKKKVIDGINILIAENKEGEYNINEIKNKPSSKYIMLYKENNHYRPIYKIINDGNIRGILNIGSEFLN